jgi:S1-C subfamily serine protease
LGLPLFTAALAAWRAEHGAGDKDAAPEASSDAVVRLSVKAVEGARTADTLGSEREGSGVVIDASGLILTIGYLVLEAASILVITGDGRVFAASVVGFDHASGFGLLRARPGVARHPLELGDSSQLRALHTVTVAAHPAAGAT